MQTEKVKWYNRCTIVWPYGQSDVINYLTEGGINIILHLSCSCESAPCDYWLNDDIKRGIYLMNQMKND